MSEIIYRHALQYLKEWKEKPERKPLIMRGARQVGKTTLVKSFAHSFRHFIHLNLERSEHRVYFDRYTTTEDLVQAIFFQFKVASKHKDTLLFIDEIQESPAAIQQLRFLYEDYPHLHVIAAGSLLEFTLKEVKSFPVGRVEYLQLHPLNFEEYLHAQGNDQALSILDEIPIPGYAHQSLLDAFHDYALLGGMPEVVQHYAQYRDLTRLNPIYEGLWTSYKDDVQKYARNATDRKVILHVINSAAQQIDQRITFHGFGRSQYGSTEVGQALRALHEARVIQLIYPTTQLAPPYSDDLKKRPRLQFLDTGLLNYALGIRGDMIGIDDLSPIYRGTIAQHLVTQQLMSIHYAPSYHPNFWVREKKTSNAEVDLVYQRGARLYPIEIKAGADGRLRSLHQFVDRADHPYAVRLYAGPLKIDEVATIDKKPYRLLNLPYYLATRLPEYIDWFTRQQ